MQPRTARSLLLLSRVLRHDGLSVVHSLFVRAVVYLRGVWLRYTRSQSVRYLPVHPHNLSQIAFSFCAGTRGVEDQ